MRERPVKGIGRCIAAPIRDLAQTADGRLALLHDDGQVTTLRRSDAPCAEGGATTVHAIHCADIHRGPSATAPSPR